MLNPISRINLLTMVSYPALLLKYEDYIAV